MKKILLLSTAACCLILYACKKDSNDTTTPETETTKPAIDPVALAANIKVGYSATSDTGAIPTASSDAGAPILDTRYDNQTYYAVNNRYIVIYPTTLSGAVKGYYLKINGANSHFKIDYTTAYNLRKAKSSSLFGMREGDNSDSSIVIKLPAGLKGDTFSIKYAAYDSLNHVSNTINAIVSIVASTNAADDAALLGTWKITKFQIGDQIIPYGQTDSTDFAYYTCEDNVLISSNNADDIKIPGSIYTYDFIFQFSANNLLNITQAYTASSFKIDSSTCSNFVYSTSTESSPAQVISYSYNSTTKVITMISDNNGTGNNITTEQYTVSELSSSKLAMYFVIAQGDHDQLTVAHFEFKKSAQ
jgi:hypothetical protein